MPQAQQCNSFIEPSSTLPDKWRGNTTTRRDRAYLYRGGECGDIFRLGYNSSGTSTCSGSVRVYMLRGASCVGARGGGTTAL